MGKNNSFSTWEIYMIGAKIHFEKKDPHTICHPDFSYDQKKSKNRVESVLILWFLLSGIFLKNFMDQRDIQILFSITALYISLFIQIIGK